MGRVLATSAIAALREMIAIAQGERSDPENRPQVAPGCCCLWVSLDDLSDCDEPASSWRWGDDQGGWTPVCHNHTAKTEATE